MIFHLATVADWREAQATGSYATSTRGRTLAEEGFVHCSRSDQWPAVRERWYADVTEPLVLLVIDPELLSSPVVEEQVGGTGESFPHVYGPIDSDAVVRAVALEQALADLDRSFTSLFVAEMVRRVGLALVVMVVAVGGLLVGAAVGSDTGAAVGILVGLVAGVGVAWVVLRSRGRAGRRGGRRGRPAGRPPRRSPS